MLCPKCNKDTAMIVEDAAFNREDEFVVTDEYEKCYGCGYWKLTDIMIGDNPYKTGEVV